MIVVCACQDPAQARIPLSVTSEPAATTSGAVITLSSPQFSDITLRPSADTVRPNRWSNFAVIVGNDTAQSWRLGPTQIAFRVPPVYTGNHEAVVVAEGYDPARASFYAVGLRYPMYWGGLEAYTNVQTGTVLPVQGVLVSDNGPSGGGWGGYALIDVQDQRLRVPSQLRASQTNLVKMYTPGPSYRPNHFIFDLSPRGRAAPTIWNVDSWTLVDSLPCGASVTANLDDYTAAELSSTTCLSLNFAAVVRNFTDTVFRAFYTANGGAFRLSPGGKWAAIRTPLTPLQCCLPPMRWPVFNQSGDVVYTIDTLFTVPGVAFSTFGDTMFVTASTKDDSAANGLGARFALALYETATGRFLAGRSFPATRALQDVTLDPVRPLIYVSGIDQESVDPFSPFREFLTVLDRRTLEIIADMPAPGIPYYTSVGDASLVYQGGAGRVSVVGSCGYDCGGLWVFTFDLP